MIPESDSSIASLIEDLPGFVYRCRNDRDWTIVYVSDQVEALTGYAPGELTENQACSYGDLIHPEDRKRVWDEVQSAIEDGDSFELEYRLRTREGDERWVWEQGRAVREDDQDESYLQGFIQDITNRKQGELENDLFGRISKLVSQSSDYASSVSGAVREICRATGWDYAELWILRSGGEEEMSAEVYHNPENGDLEAYWEEAREARVERGHGLVGRVWESGRSEWLEKVSGHSGFLRSDQAEAPGLETALGVPCLSGNTVAGVLVVYLKEKHRRDLRMIELLTTLGEQLGTLLKQKQLETKLADRETLYRQILENVQVDLWMMDPQLESFLYTNPAFEDTWDDYFEDAEDPVEAFLRTVHPEDRERIRQAVADLPKTTGFDERFRLQRLTDGELRWFHHRAFVVSDASGDPVRVVGFGEDITETRRHHLQLKRTVDEKNTLLQELNHRVKNNLQLIISLINLQKRNHGNESMIREFDDIKNRVYSMALIHELVYEQASLSDLRADEYLIKLIDSIFDTAVPSSLDLHREVTVDPVPLNVETLLPCGLILNELLTNALMHAFDGREEGRVDVRFHQDEDERLELFVADDGTGFEEGKNFEDVSSMGLRIVETLVEDQLNGRISLTHDGGLEYRILFEKKSPS